MKWSIGSLLLIAVLVAIAVKWRGVISDGISFHEAAIAFGLVTAARALFQTALRTRNGWFEFFVIRGAMSNNLFAFATGKHLAESGKGGQCFYHDRYRTLAYRDQYGHQTIFTWDLVDIGGGGYAADPNDFQRTGDRSSEDYGLLRERARPFSDYLAAKEKYPLAYLLDRVWRGSVGGWDGANIERGLSEWVAAVRWHIRREPRSGLTYQNRWDILRVWRIRPWPASLQAMMDAHTKDRR